MPSRVEVAATIRSSRKALGLRQEDLAELVGVTRKTVIQWEKGQEPTENREELARALGLEVGDLTVNEDVAPSAADRLAAELAALREEVHALVVRVREAGPAVGHTGGASEALAGADAQALRRIDDRVGEILQRVNDRDESFRRLEEQLAELRQRER